MGAYGIRGRRPAMEDRIVCREVRVEGGGGAVAINAVLDGHGGQVRERERERERDRGGPCKTVPTNVGTARGGWGGGTLTLGGDTGGS